jgi:Flp pilus assembly pilin Flp
MRSVALVLALFFTSSTAPKGNLVKRLLRQLLRDQAGQEVIEYALLTAFIGCIGLLAWTNIRTGIGNAYTGWGAGVQTLSTCTPDPIAISGLPGGGCGGGS